jgi:GNAT superfamily N-acetyltransferase
MSIAIKRLTSLSPAALAEMLIESERDGWHFVRRLLEEWEDGSNRFDRPGEALFATGDGRRIIGVCGLNRDPYSAEPDVGRVRRLYVLRDYRRQGVGQSLLLAVVGSAAGRFHWLRLRTESLQAAGFYERLGFRAVAGVSHYTHVLELTADALPKPNRQEKSRDS